MKRQIPGLHLNQRGVEGKLEGLFLVRVDRASYRWHPQKPFVEIRFVVLEPKSFETRIFSGRLCSSGGIGRTSMSQPRCLAIWSMCSASAPQLTTTFVIPGT